jgi:hypothetical protein
MPKFFSLGKFITIFLNLYKGYQNKNLIETTKHDENKKKKQSNNKILLSHIEENVETNFNNDSHSNSPTSRINASELYFNKSSNKRKKPQQCIETMHQLLGDKTYYSLDQKEPISKFPGGAWVNYNDFKKYFNCCLFFYNEKKFRNILNVMNLILIFQLFISIQTLACSK